MNAAPVTAVVLGLVSVTVICEVAPGAISDGAKDFVTVGCERTASVELAPAEVPAFAVVTLPVLFR